MEVWANQLSNEFKKRNNQPVLGAILGTVISPPPKLKISILDGQVFITEVYILDSILEDYSRLVTMPIESALGEITLQPYETTREDGVLLEAKDYKINVFEIQNKEIITKDTLKIGNQVLLVSSQDNQVYFCLGRVSRIGE